MKTQRIYSIYTDGSCPNNGKPSARAGWGAVIINETGHRWLLGGPVEEQQVQTNSRAELMAITEVLRKLSAPSIIHIFTDSQYIANSFNLHLGDWIKKGFRRAGKKPVAHTDLWEKIVAARERHTLSIDWIPGHSGNKHNDTADGIAHNGARGIITDKKDPV